MKIVVCMLYSNRFSIASATVRSVVRYIPLDHMIVSAADRAKEYTPKILALLPKHVKTTVLPGCNNRLTMARHRFLQFDVAAKLIGSDDGWIVNVDDDDLVLGFPCLADAPVHAGIFHTDIAAICTQDSGDYRKCGDHYIRPSKEITKPSDGHFFTGSFWGVRAAAWRQLAPVVDRVTVFEDWALAYQAIKHGWKDWHIPQVMQTQRLRDHVEAALTQQATGNTWEKYVSDLERKPR